MRSSMFALTACLFALASVRAEAQVRVDPPPYEQPKPQDTQINGNGVRQTVDCKGDAVYIQGQENQVEVRGDCRLVRVQGNRNLVILEHRTTVAVEGNENLIQFADPKTRVSERGERNRFEKRATARLLPLN